MFTRIAIVNRGEAAVRLLHAVAELASAGAEAPRTIALHTEAERHAMFVRLADEAVQLEPTGDVNPYLDYDAIAQALVAARADAAWVGWGFVAEHPDFADRCAELGVTFIGPSGDVMRRLGDKIGAKTLAEQQDVPVAAWSNGPVENLLDARKYAEQIGYPLMIKATAGGGGRGIRRVNGETELDTAFERASSEALRSFGDATVFMERVVEDARHIEVQIVADTHGNAWALGVRDCSLQRRNQKVIEESASTVLTDEQVDEVKAAAVRLVLAAEYTNVGTVEFLYQPDDASFAFLEVNTRLQVEHPVTEVTTGFDLVKLQLQMAAGWELDGEPPPTNGHAIEARLNAEDPDRAFAPSPGTIDLLSFPTGPGVRVDTGVAEGDVIPAEYDAMIAKVIAWGANRDEALRRLRRALSQTTAVITGGATNKSFLLDLLDRPEVLAGDFDTQWLDRLTIDGGHHIDRHADVALVVAAIDAWAAETAIERGAFYASAGRGRPKAAPSTSRRLECRFRGDNYTIDISRISPAEFSLTVDGTRVEASVDRLGRSSMHLTFGSSPSKGRRHRVTSVIDGMEHVIDVDGVAHRVSRDDGGLLRAPAPALVVAVTAEVDQVVSKGTPLVVLESMKVETPVLAPFDGRVTEVMVTPNVQVDAAAPLIRLDAPAAESDGADDKPISRVTFEALAHGTDGAAGQRGQLLALLDSMRWHVLGFDLEADDLVSRYRELKADVADDEEVLDATMAVLNAFADIATLSRNRPADEQSLDDAHSPQEYFHRYLRSLDIEAEGLSDGFRLRLLAALAHFGIDDLDRTPELERAAYGLFISQGRAAAQVPSLLALLAGPAPELNKLSPASQAALRATLDNVIEATQLRHPAVGDAARNYRYQCFDATRLSATRAAALRESRSHLDYLANNPNASDWSERLQLLVQSPQRLIRLLVDKDENGFYRDRDALVEVLTRRNYQIDASAPFRTGQMQGSTVLTASSQSKGERLHVVTTLASADDLEAAVSAAAAVAAKAPGGESLVMDIYVRWGEAAVGAEVLAASIAVVLSSVDIPAVVQRISISGAALNGSVHHFTFDRTSLGFDEDRAVRGLHPMVAERLQIWRLKNFDLERLPSAEDTYLFAGVARDNTRDQRLFGAAEVRDLIPVRNADGEVTALPELERVLAASLHGLRSAQASYPRHSRPLWNRVHLYVWPEIDIPLEELTTVAPLIAPITQGLDLEDVRVQAKLRGPDGISKEVVIVLKPSDVPGSGFDVRLADIPTTRLQPIDDYTANVLAARRRGAPYPYELLQLLTGERGTFVEYDIDEDGSCGPVERAPGLNSAGVVIGLLSTATDRYPEGMLRVALLSDPTKSLGSIAEPECRRILAGLDLAEQMQIPVEWFAVSAGAKVAMDSGTENMDWISRVLRRIVEFTQGGSATADRASDRREINREINVVVTGINVGAQPYWNAEATMLTHTRGILVMTPDSAMVLTGKQALDYSGGVSAEDNFGIGGYDRIMGPNGQAQYWAPDLAAACDVLFEHYEHSYVAPGEDFPRPAQTSDPSVRSVAMSPHDVEGLDFTTVGQVFSEDANPGRKKAFDIRAVMRAVIDADHPPLERWAAMRDAESVVVFDAHLGGNPISMLGIESRPMPRFGLLPADGPDQWTSGTLFPLSSKKAAHAINAASGSRPLVVLANLSGFDGSPESLARLQLEYGAEIGRAVVNFDGPIVFCVISRYHGGAFVVFSGALNDRMQVLAVEGTKASVLGGAPAAAVVFAGEVRKRVNADDRIVSLQGQIDATGGIEQVALQAELAELREQVKSEKLGEVAVEFDTIHSVERAQEVGSVHEIIPADELRARLIAAVEHGIADYRPGGGVEIDLGVEGDAVVR